MQTNDHTAKKNRVINAQLIVAKYTDKAHGSWWRISCFTGNLYLQRGADM